MKQIPHVPAETPLKDDKFVDRVARHNPKVYDRKYDPVELEEWIRGIDKIFYSGRGSRRKESKH